MPPPDETTSAPRQDRQRALQEELRELLDVVGPAQLVDDFDQACDRLARILRRVAGHARGDALEQMF